MTETSPATLLTPIDMPSSKHGSCGLLLPNTNARVMDLEKEVALGPNRTGELQFKGPQVTFKKIRFIFSSSFDKI